MVSLINSPMISKRAHRVSLVLHGIFTAIVGTFLLCVVSLIIGMIYDFVTGQEIYNGPLYFPILMWFFGSPLWVMGLLVSWPIATLAFRAGKAGPLATVAAGAIFGGLVNFAIVPQEGLSFALFGAIIGMIFAAFYWIGVSRKTAKIMNERG